MSQPRPLSGVLPVFQTPYHTDESIDFDTLTREIDWLYSQGADGLVMGMVSETLRLSGEERRAVTAHACKASAGRGPVVISTGAESTRVACEFARHAESVGADALMAIPPISAATTEVELRRYFHGIVESVRIPLVVQDASGYVGRPMSIEFQATLQRDLGDRIYFKPEAAPIGPRLTALRDATAGQARILEGTGGIALVDSYRRGIVGTMPGADLIRAIVPLWHALRAGDESRIAAIEKHLCDLVALQTTLDAFLAIEKHLLLRQGVFQNTHVRGPVGYVLDAITRDKVDRLFDLLMQAVR